MTQTLTTERLREIASSPSFSANPLSHEVKYMARELLANREAQPVMYASKETLAYAKEGEKSLVTWSEPMGDAVIPLFTAPPAPAVNAAPDFDAWFNSPEAGFRVVNFHIQHELQMKAWNACCAAMLAQPASQGCKLSMQPLVIDTHGAVRFKQNPIVRRLLDYATEHGYGLNEIAMEQFEADDQMQLAQLIGYSLSGYGTLSYVTDESYDRALAAAPEGGNEK
nr:hypothetical protein [uncultured Serratia sp.]DAM25284.1 MAG TPA: hypothetical protein [Caudoviricetes sp.]